MELRSLVFACVLVCSLSSALAAAPRTFVSGSGNDNAPCTRQKPCRTFDRAISLTDPGGEVLALDSAGYGPFTVRKALTVAAAPGVYAGITETTPIPTIAIDIAAGSSDTVILRGLTVNSLDPDAIGIRFLSGNFLYVENCILNSTEFGITAIGNGSLNVKDSILRGNHFGISISPLSGTATATLDHVRLEGNSDGLDAFEGARVNVYNSVASGNTNLGFGATSFTSQPVEMNLEGCVSSDNGHFGIAVASMSTGSATVRLSNSTVTHNAVIGLNIGNAPATLLSRGNNTVEGNATDVSGVLGSYLPK